MIEERILPFYLMLTTCIQNWPRVLSGSLGQAAESGVSPIAQLRPNKPLPIPPSQQPRSHLEDCPLHMTVPAKAPVEAPVSTTHDHDHDQLVREITQLRAQVQDLNHVVERERQANQNTTQEIERLRAENTELRHDAPEKIDVAEVKAENVQLRQRVALSERQVRVAAHGIITAMQATGHMTARSEEIQRNQADEIEAMRRRIADLESRQEQAPAPAAVQAGEAGDDATLQELQQQLEQRRQELEIRDAILGILVQQNRVTEGELQQIIEEITREQASELATTDGPAAHNAK